MQQTELFSVYMDKKFKRMTEKDKAAAELFRNYSGRLFRTALRITLSEDEAEEIMQETLIRYISGHGNRFSADSRKAWAWLKTTCVRLSIDWLRRQKHFMNLDESAAGMTDNDEDSGIWTGLGEDVFPMVMELLSEMPDGYRTVLTLKLIEEYGYPEIASMLGISEAGVRSQYMRGRQMLAARLEEKLKKGKKWTK